MLNELFLSDSNAGIVQALIISFFDRIITGAFILGFTAKISLQDSWKLCFQFFILHDQFLQGRKHDHSSCSLAILIDLVGQTTWFIGELFRLRNYYIVDFGLRAWTELLIGARICQVLRLFLFLELCRGDRPIRFLHHSTIFV